MTQFNDKRTHTLPELVLESGRAEGKVIKIPSLDICINAPYTHKGPPTEIWVLAIKRSDGDIPEPCKILDDTIFFDKESAIINKNLYDNSDSIGIFKGVIYLEEILEG